MSVQVQTVHYLAQPENETLPYVSHTQQTSSEWFQCFFCSDTLWFSVAAYLAYSRLSTKANISAHGFAKKMMVPNVAFIANEDHDKMEEWLNA